MTPHDAPMINIPVQIITTYRGKKRWGIWANPHRQGYKYWGNPQTRI